MRACLKNVLRSRVVDAVVAVRMHTSCNGWLRCVLCALVNGLEWDDGDAFTHQQYICVGQQQFNYNLCGHSLNHFGIASISNDPSRLHGSIVYAAHLWRHANVVSEPFAIRSAQDINCFIGSHFTDNWYDSRSPRRIAQPIVEIITTKCRQLYGAEKYRSTLSRDDKQPSSKGSITNYVRRTMSQCSH